MMRSGPKDLTRHGERLGNLYAEHAAEATRLAYLLTGDASLAEDITQEAFVKLIGRYVYFRDGSSFRGYMRKTVVNLARMHFRQRGREQKRLRRLEHFDRPPQSYESVESRQLVLRPLLDLPDKQRAAIALRYYLDLSYSDIADILACREGTARSLISRGLEQLRSAMGGLDHD